jgi:hypothetical protein
MIKTAGICHMCRLDFPVQLGRRIDNLNLYNPQTYTRLTSQFTQPSE